MNARPFGEFNGVSAIQAFWQGLMDGGYSSVEYFGSKLQIIDEASALLTAKWKMNKAAGVIHRELWVLQGDGRAKLREDDFEVDQ